MEQKALTYTVLLTRDEYIAFRVRQKKQDRKERLPLLTFAGAVGFLAGAAGPPCVCCCWDCSALSMTA